MNSHMSYMNLDTYFAGALSLQLRFIEGQVTSKTLEDTCLVITIGKEESEPTVVRFYSSTWDLDKIDERIREQDYVGLHTYKDKRATDGSAASSISYIREPDAPERSIEGEQRKLKKSN